MAKDNVFRIVLDSLYETMKLQDKRKGISF